MHRRGWLVCAAALTLCAGDLNEDLLQAARKGDLDNVKALIGKGASLESKTSYGQTPLYLAAMNGHQAVVEYLLEKGANTEIKDTFYKENILGFVLYRKHYDVAKLLIAKSTGTPDDLLKEVADSERPELVQAVLDKGKPGQHALDTAYESALERKQASVAEVLKKAGAQEPTPGVAVDGKILESYTGTYKTEDFPIDLKVFVKEGKLFMQATGQDAFAPKPKSATAFVYQPAGLEIEFDSPASFTLKQGGRTMKFKKAAAQ